MIRAHTKSADDTRELGAQLAGLVRPGDVILLAGDLGAGKTTLAQGFGRALGVTEPVLSPTFMLVRTYESGRIPPLVHADLYRLDHLQEILDLGLLELLDFGGVALLEWGDMAVPALPADFLEIRLEFAAGDEDRLVQLRVVGPSWAPRQRALQSALERWLQE